MGSSDNPSTTMTVFTQNITEEFITNVTANVTELISSTSKPSMFSGGNEELKAAMKKLFDILLTANICVVMLALGCTIEMKHVKANFRRPIGLIIGLVCQFILFPLITFGLAHALQLEKWNAVGMILLGTAPGGTISNILTYYCEAELTLSVSMTATSNLVALGMMPLNLWIYSRSWTGQDTFIPYQGIFIGLATMLIPVAIGMLIHWKLPRVGNVLIKIGAVLGLLMLLALLAVNSYLYPHVFLSGWGIWVGAVVLPVIGLTIGYVAATIFRQPPKSRRAIAIETGCQNVTLVIGLITIFYGKEVYLDVMVFPELFGTIGYALVLILCGIYKVQKVVRRRLNPKDTEKKRISIDDVVNMEVHENAIICDETVEEKVENGDARKVKNGDVQKVENGDARNEINVKF